MSPRHAAVIGLVLAALLAASPSFAVVHVVGTNGSTFFSNTAGATWSATGVPSASVSLFGVWYTSDSNGIAVGNGNSIFQTFNGGTTWSPVTSPITTVYNDVMFPDAQNGYIAAADGHILKTVNGGSTWTTPSPGVGAGMVSVFFINASTGWAAGIGGVVARTTTGGTTWNNAAVSPATDLNDIFFIDANTGWAVGKTGHIWKSTNGGVSWSPETSGTSADLAAVWFTSSTLGFACGGDRILLKTTNGGTNWSPVTLPTVMQQSGLFDVMFADPDTGLVVGSGQNAFFTTDGGTNWQFANPDPDPTNVWQAVHVTRPPGPTPNVTITVNSVPTGRMVNFDGATNTTPFTKTFPSGESHTLATPTPQPGPTGTQYAFSQWSGGSTSTGASITIAPTANTTYTANMTTQYQLTMSSAAHGSTTPAAGTSFRNAGSAVNISASPSPGYTFSGWTGSGSGSYTGPNSPQSIVMNGPITETPSFTLSTITTTITTNPAGKQVIVNNVPHTAPFQLTQNANLPITIDVPSPQTVNSTERLTYASWSDGGAQSHTITPSSSQTFTASFDTEYFLDTGVAQGLGTVTPTSRWVSAGQRVAMDFTPNSGYFLFLWTDGVSGAAISLVPRYSFFMNGPVSIRGNFSNLTPVPVTVGVTPPGKQFKVVGLPFTTTQSFDWPKGLNLQLAAVTPQNRADNLERWIYDHWSDGGASTHFANPGSALSNPYTVTYQAQFPLTMATVGVPGTTNPAAGVTWEDSAAVVQITATPGQGNRFVSWTGSGAGSYTGTQNPRNVTVANAFSETATFEITPFLKITAPSVATNLVAGEPVSLTWNTNVGGNVTIQWRNGPAGANNTIVASTPNDGQYTWTPPDMPMNTLYLRVADAVDSDPVDLVGPFTLCDPYFAAGPVNGAAFTSAPEQVTYGDYNEDGILDLLYTSEAGFAKRLGLGSGGVGNGGFAAAVLTQLLARSRSVEAVDIDRDDRLDLVVGMDDGRLLTFRGDGTGAVGNGNFLPASQVSGGSSLRDLEPGDFNEDGNVDIVAADSSLGVLFYAGSAAIGLLSPVATSVGGMARVVKACDFNGDGIQDLVVGTQGVAGHDLAILRGQGIGAKGDGAFVLVSALGSAGTTSDIVVRDFDGDGHADFAWIDDALHQLKVARFTGIDGNTNPVFAIGPAIALSTGARSLAAGDFDRDGHVDLAVTETGTPRVRVFAGAGDGSFALLTTIPTTSTGVDVAVAEDFLEDNRPDLAIASTSGSAMITDVWTGGLTTCAPATQSVALTSQNAPGTVVNTGAELPITWATVGAGLSAVDVDLSRDDGARWETIARNVPGTALSWTVTPPAATTCRIRVRESGMRNRGDTSDATFQITNNTIGVDPVPAVAALSAAWPNPSRGQTWISLSLPKDARATLVVYDLAGRIVRRLVDGPLTAGVHPVAGDGMDERGAKVSGGVYFVRARWPGFAAERRVVLVH